MATTRKFNEEAKREYQRKWRAARDADPERLAAKREYHRKYLMEWKKKPGNREKTRKAAIATYYKYREKSVAASHWANVKRKYGITRDQYDQILVAQGAGCAICGMRQEENGKRLSIDHCHKSTVVRGLLCEVCNVLLGRVEAKPGWILKAQEYLLNHPAAKVVTAKCPTVARSGLGKGINWGS